MESLVLSPMSANQDLIANLTAVPAFPRNVTINQTIWNYLVDTSEVICWIDLGLSLKEGDFVWNNLLFW